MYILLLERSLNDTISRIQDNYPNTQIVLHFKGKFDHFSQLKEKYLIPDRIKYLTQTELTRLQKAKKIIIQEIDSDLVPKYVITDKIKQLLEKLEIDQTVLLNLQRTNRIKPVMDESGLLNQETLEGIYEKWQNEEKKIEKKKQLIQQNELELEERERTDMLREKELNRRQQELEKREKANSNSLNKKVQEESNLNQSVLEHASAVMKLEEERAKFEAMKKAFEDKMVEDKEKLREEREKVTNKEENRNLL